MRRPGLILALLISGPLAGTAQERVPMDLHIPFTQFALGNGLNVIVHEDHSLPIVSVNLWYHVGSGNERPGRTGFAHLFEHIMFEGSAHVPEGDFDNLLEAVGGTNNGSTNPDRTNYWANLPSNALELALWLEADRMGWLLETMDQEKLDIQRAVVKNERRQSYENRPYGLAFEQLGFALFPEDHPYHWPTIGSMEDLSAATLADVTEFFRTHYAPNNASLSIAGAVSTRRVRELVEKYFGPVPQGPEPPPIEPPPVGLDQERYLLLEDDVRLPRLYMAWHSPPVFSDGDAAMDMAGAVLAEGKSSRLHRRLVYEEQVAQDVAAFQLSQELGSRFLVIVTGRPDVQLEDLEAAVRDEVARLAGEGPTDLEMERVVNQIEASFVNGLQRVGGFGGKADQLNRYYFTTGNPGFVRRDLARFHRQTPETVAAAVGERLDRAHAVVLSVVPRGRADLGAREGA
jgi:zinc protease